MAEKTSKQKQASRKSFMDDVRKSGFKRTLKQDFRDIYDFYIDKETRARLSSMSRFRRWIRIAYYILKNLITKLSPIRRLLLLISLFLMISIQNVDTTGDFAININMKFFGYFIILLILLLELKDKLLAKDELAAGRAVQKSLMPEMSPEFPGWDIWLHTQPANDVGGDLVDYIELREERLGIVIGDVSGKGLGAALFSTRLQATMRALAPTLTSMTELGAHMNNIFCRDCLPQFFATLIYLELTPNSQVRFINAGHMPPFLINDGEIQELEQGGTALGIMPKTTYEEQRLNLESGQMLCFYSDGVSEARNEAGDFFGEDRLSKSLIEHSQRTAEEIGNKILEAVKSFIGEARVSDDLSLVILKRSS